MTDAQGGSGEKTVVRGSGKRGTVGFEYDEETMAGVQPPPAQLSAPSCPDAGSESADGVGTTTNAESDIGTQPA